MKTENVYLKKIGKRGKINIWLVNGSQIRRDLDQEFTNFGQHFRFSFIPLDEFWIDREAAPDERKYFIDHLLVEWRLMKRGESYLKALEKADLIEKSEREKNREVKKIINGDHGEKVAAIHQHLLGKAKKKVAVWLVDGNLVRSIFLPYFTEGGHDLKYNFIPQNEVWIDNDVFPAERPDIILHELYERQLMLRGLLYSQAHRRASRLEWQSRMDKDKLKQNLVSLSWKEQV